VPPGATWDDIATELNVDVGSLLSANNIDPNASPVPPPTEGAFLVVPSVPYACVAPESSNTAAVCSSPHGRLFTSSPNEVPTQNTRWTAQQLLPLLRQAWPDLNEEGARVLTAQAMHETNASKNCYNWNLGNVKASSANVEHMYLRGVWERLSEALAQQLAGSANVHIASDEEKRAHHWTCRSNQEIVVFDPPHPAARFRAWDSLQDGVAGWIRFYQRLANNNPTLLTALNNGDIPTVAQALADAHYYTGDERDYARDMASFRALVERQLGPP
jgi:hypothetical protein